MKIYSKILNNQDLCFDVGANSGNKTQEILSFNTKVVCVEPQKDLYDILKNKFSNNNNVILINKALSSYNGISEIFISGANTLSSMSSEFISTTSKLRFRGVSWNSVEKVETTTLDDLIKIYGCPKFCKIDVEGYESEVLKGLTKKIPFISLEFVPELKHKTFECIEILSKISNCEFNYSEGESMEFTFNDWVSKDEIINFLKKNNDFEISFGDLYVKMI